jgi:hypothetical protein
MKPWLLLAFDENESKVPIIFLSDFPPRITRSRIPFSLPTKLTEWHMRTAPPTQRQGHERKKMSYLFFFLFLVMFDLEIHLAHDYDKVKLSVLSMYMIWEAQPSSKLSLEHCSLATVAGRKSLQCGCVVTLPGPMASALEKVCLGDAQHGTMLVYI